MAYENKTQANDPAFGRHGQDESDDGPKFKTSADVLAFNDKVVKGLQASIDAAPHPYSISAEHDKNELRMRARMHRRK